MAPSVSVEDIRTSLRRVYRDWLKVSEYTQNNALRIGKDWSWQRVTDDWLKGQEK
jgi:hypothetical protein